MKKAIAVLLLVAVLVVSGCIQITKEEKEKADLEEKAEAKSLEEKVGVKEKPATKATKETPESKEVKDFDLKEVNAQDSPVYYSQRCPSGQAMQSFNLEESEEPGCVSLPSVSDSGAIVTGSAWRLLVGGEESQIGNGDSVELQAGEGISLSKEGNIVTIGSTGTAPVEETMSSGEAASTGSTWTLSVPALKAASSSSINVGDGNSVKVKGSGATSVSLDTKTRELTVSSTVYTWNLGTGLFGTPFEIKSGDTVRIVGEGATIATQDSANKQIIITTPAVKQYQYRTVRGWCQKIDGNWAPYHEDAGINLEQCGKSTVAECTEGRIINYGGRCQTTGSNNNAIQYLSPEHLAIDSNAYSTSWSDLPTIRKIVMHCREDSTSYVHVFLTCVREKP